jgi:capsular exopolysaccharide synthesis family protein
MALPLAAAAWFLAPGAPTLRYSSRVDLQVGPESSVGLVDPHAVWDSPETATRTALLLVEGAKGKREDVPGLTREIAEAVRVERVEGGVRVVAEAPTAPLAAMIATLHARAGAEEAAERRERAFEAAVKEKSARSKELRDRASLLPEDPEGTESRARELERRIAAVTAAAQEIERQVEEVRAREDRIRARLRLLEGDEHRLREFLPTGPEDEDLRSPVLDRIRGEIVKVRSEIALRGLERALESPEYQEKKARLGELDQALRIELHKVRAQTVVGLRDSLTGMETELRTLDERRLRKTLELRDLADDLQAAAKTNKDRNALNREADALEEEGRRLASAARGPAPYRISGPATDPQASGEEGRRGAFRAWGLGIAALFGLAAMLALEAVDGRIRSGRDVKRMLGLTCLGVVERSREPLILRDPHGAAAESYAMAATMLRGYLAERDFKVVLVSGALPGEGKSTAAANLAAALSRKGGRVALLDCDFRRPRLHEFFGMEPTRDGLASYLVGAELDPELPDGATEHPALKVLTSGPLENVTPEFLESARMADLLKILRDRYDAVILDGPPLTGASEALGLARMADTILWVVRAGRTDASRMAWARQLLDNVRADVAGALVTQAAKSDVRRYQPAA